MADVTLQDWEGRKEFVGFDSGDAEVLKELGGQLNEYINEIVDELYGHLFKFGQLRDFLPDEDATFQLKAAQKNYFCQLLEGEYGAAYLMNRLRVGRAHQRIGLSVHWYMGTYLIYQQIIMDRIEQVYAEAPDQAKAARAALQKIITLDQEVAITTYIAAREDVIAQQADEIIELSTPVVQVWEGVLTAPIIGTLDTNRTRMFMERLLEAIVETRSPVALVDITGVPAVDTATAQHLIDTINAVKLLGAQVVITGVSPAIAQTLVHLGINLSGVVTRASLASGLAVAMEIVGLEVKPKGNLVMEGG